MHASSQIDDDYVTASELNMPLSNQLHGTGNSTQQKTAPWFSSEVKIEQQFRLERPISNSANQLLSISQGNNIFIPLNLYNSKNLFFF